MSGASSAVGLSPLARHECGRARALGSPLLAVCHKYVMPHFCPDAPVLRDWDCYFPPSNLADALEHHASSNRNHARNNEVVIDLRSVLPRLAEGVIEAFFIQPAGAERHAEAMVRAYNRFLNAFYGEASVSRSVC